MKALLSTILIIISLATYSQEVIYDDVYFKDGKHIQGTIVKVTHPQYIKMIVKDSYLATFHYKDISSITFSTKKGSSSSLYLISKEKISGSIIHIKPDTSVSFILALIPDILSIHSKDISHIVYRSRKLSIKEMNIKKGGEHYFSFGPGIGRNYGFLGWKAQYKYGEMMGIATHVGLGIYPDIFTPAVSLWYNVGIKLYPFYWFYVGFNYGIVAREYKKIPPYTNYDFIIIDHPGLSIAIGADYFFNDRSGINVGIGTVLSSFDHGVDMAPVFDIGFIFKIPIKKHSAE